MAGITEIIRLNEDGTLSFGNYELKEKTKVNDFEVNGRFYKAKSFYEVTKLKKDGALVYESLPGTVVHHFDVKDDIVSFQVEGNKMAQITLEIQPDAEYKLLIEDVLVDHVKTSSTGKVGFSVELKNETKKVVLKKIG